MLIHISLVSGPLLLPVLQHLVGTIVAWYAGYAATGVTSRTAHEQVVNWCSVVGVARNGPPVPHLAGLDQAAREITPGDAIGAFEVLLRKDDLVHDRAAEVWSKLRNLVDCTLGHHMTEFFKFALWYIIGEVVRENGTGVIARRRQAGIHDAGESAVADRIVRDLAIAILLPAP